MNTANLALNTIKRSTGHEAMDYFISLNNNCYIYGEKNKGMFPAESILIQKGIPVFYINNSGHSMAEENPDDLYLVISNYIRESN